MMYLVGGRVYVEWVEYFGKLQLRPDCKGRDHNPYHLLWHNSPNLGHHKK
jgi:hypothetical protein